jgi:hypothetical protein
MLEPALSELANIKRTLRDNVVGTRQESDSLNCDGCDMLKDISS